jgi:hypothetical protein
MSTSLRAANVDAASSGAGLDDRRLVNRDAAAVRVCASHVGGTVQRDTAVEFDATAAEVC